MAIGRSEPRVDAPAKVTGAALYPADLRAPGGDACLFAKVVFSGQPHARMRRMDVTAARAAPGVVAIFGAADVPVNAMGLCRQDRPVLVGPALGMVPRPGRPDPTVSRWEADHIALVVAETEAQACAAAERIETEWEPLPVIDSVERARRDDLLVHPEDPSHSNVYERVPLRKGPRPDWDAIHTVVEGTYVIPHQEHAYLQPEAALAYVDDQDRITVEVAGQWAHDDRAQIASALDLPIERVRVRYPAIGGAFGGREDVSVQIVMALAAWRLAEGGERRAIRTVWSREESILGHHKGHWMRIRTRWGADRTGDLRAVEATIELDSGAYNSTSDVLVRNTLTHICGPYDVPSVHADGLVIYTNNVPTGALRGFGAPQACFAAEMQMTRLAAALGVDPVALRRRNALRAGSMGVHQTAMPDPFAIDAVIDACAAAANVAEAGDRAPTRGGFRSLTAEPAALRTGRGFACGFKNVGYSFGNAETCAATLELHGGDTIGEVVVSCAAAEVGQGVHTVLRQLTAEATGVPFDRTVLVASDTATSGDSGSASASRLSFMTGHAIRAAADAALRAWRNGARPARGEGHYSAPPTTPLDPESGRCLPHVTYGTVAQSVDLTVDIETGVIEIARVVCAHDAGTVIHPAGVRGQIEGGIVQALGGAVFEELRLHDAQIVSPRLSAYLIPGIGDVPARIDVVAIDSPDPAGPFGARGVGEMPFVPLAAAIAAALHDATGVFFDELPFTPERVLARLRAHGVGTV